MTDLNFLAQENSVPRLTTLGVNYCEGLSTSSFASLSHAPNLHVLEVAHSDFNNDCLQYLADMVHLRTLDLRYTSIAGDSRLFKTLMENLFQLEELNLECCWDIGGQGAIAGALYSTHSRLRVLNLSDCNLVDDDLNGIGALKNTLEALHLSSNSELTNEGLVKLKVLKLDGCDGIDNLLQLLNCASLEELNVSKSAGLTDDSFKVFSEEPNSFPNLRVLDLSDCDELTEKVFQHLSKNSYVVSGLKELHAAGMSAILSSSTTARNNLCQLQGLRKLSLARFSARSSISKDLELKLLRELKNLQDVRLFCGESLSELLDGRSIRTLYLCNSSCSTEIIMIQYRTTPEVPWYHY